MRPRILVDLTPLRESRPFRLLFASQLLGVFASQLTLVAIPYQVYALTRSSAEVGAVSLAQLVPLVAGALVGGSLGDAFDRRRVLQVASLLLAATGAGLAANAALPHPSLVAIYLVSAVAAGLGGVVSTTSGAVVPALVGGGRLVTAYATMQIVDQLAMVGAPALGGLLIGVLHLQWVFALVAAAFVAAAVVAWRMPQLPASPPLPATPGSGGGEGGRSGSILDGLRYLKGRQVLQGAYLIDVNAMVFGLPRALFPALALTVFHGGPATLGCLYAAPGAGALVGAVSTGWLERVRRQAWAVVLAVGAWGAAIVAFGYTRTLWLALLLLAVAGWADVVSAVLRSTILQSSVPDAYRARITSVQIAVVEGGPKLGDLEAGAVASAVSTQFSVVSGGLACIAGAALLALLLPGFRRYRRAVAATQGDAPGGAP